MIRLASIGAALLLLFAFAGTASGHDAIPRCETIVLTNAEGLTADIKQGSTVVLDDVPGVGSYHVAPGTYAVLWSDGFGVTGIVVGPCEQPTPNFPCEQTGAPCLTATPTASQPVATPTPTPEATPSPTPDESFVPPPTPRITVPPSDGSQPPPAPMQPDSNLIVLLVFVAAGLGGAAYLLWPTRGNRA